MVLGGGLQKVGGNSKKFYFIDGKGERPKRDYEDKFPEGLPTLEDVKEALGVVVWCKFFHCKYNQEVQGLQRTSGTILKNPVYEPLAEQEAIWSGICTRDEIAINYQIVTNSKSDVKVPSCFVAATTKTGHIDFTKLLQPDGSPFGGNIDSQHVSDAGYGGLDSNSIYR